MRRKDGAAPRGSGGRGSAARAKKDMFPPLLTHELKFANSRPSSAIAGPLMYAKTVPGYRPAFLGALLAASFLPAVVSLLKFEVLDQSWYAITFFFSLLLIMSGAHVWLTLAYYLDPRWLKHFRAYPGPFFIAPAAILVCTVALVAQPHYGLGLATIYATTFVNLWHHAKQNWGIMSMVGKLRGADVSALRLPLV